VKKITTMYVEHLEKGRLNMDYHDEKLVALKLKKHALKHTDIKKMVFMLMMNL